MLLIVLFALVTSTDALSAPTKGTIRVTSYGSLLDLDKPGVPISKNVVSDSIEIPLGGQKWRCDVCACGFDKLKNYNQHLEGKRHKAVLDQADELWNAYKNSGPTFYDESVIREVVAAVWSLDAFMDGLQARSRSSIKRVLSSSASSASDIGQVDPNIRLENLAADKRAMLWRLLYTSNNLAPMISALPSKYVRVKELLESLEVFQQIDKLLKRCPQRVSHIYDVGCGHGLVGMLCAAAYPHITVQAIDRVPRESFQAQRRAFRSSSTADLNNLHFVTGDLCVLKKLDMGQESSQSLLICVHGCKSLTHESIELAEANQWAWLSLPCCLQAEHHLDTNTHLKVSDNVRFAMLCGAIAAKYKAETVAAIDRRITGRGIVLASSGGPNPLV